ncbi:hypothetical protein KKA14_20635 [bacterium]|nr:hypothetical protein [bacterium]
MKNGYPRDIPELFIAIETRKADQWFLQCLTTEVMQWTEDIWIMSMALFDSYWKARAAETGVKPVSLWRKTFNRLLGPKAEESHSNVITMSPAYCACCAHNPWSAILLLYGMKEKGVKGLISLNSGFGQSLFREISWNVWWQAISAIENHLKEAKTKGFKQATFKKQCQRLKLAIPRLGFKRPGDMTILHHQGVKTRFGIIMANLWSWTYDNPLKEKKTIYQTGFPWKSWTFRSPPSIKRSLDYPLSTWDQIAPLLVEDFDKLSHEFKNSGQRVTRIDWKIILEDMSECQIPIRFRNPHDLQSESGSHDTALLQANYGFFAALKEKYPSNNETSSHFLIPSVLNWQLKLSTFLSVPNIMLDIFGEAKEETSDIDVLLRLENELPVRLVRFAFHSDWLPEDSFQEEELDAENHNWRDSDINRSLEAAAEGRPLYIRDAPLLLTTTKGLPNSTFLENTMNKWWKNDTPSVMERSYFKVIDPDGNAVWVFKDSSGHWYQHGIFG